MSSEDAARRRRRRVIKLSVALMLGGVVAILAFTGFSFWWTSQPSFCNKCHVMEPFVDAWEGGSHQEVNCESCHLRPGFFSFVGGKIASLQVVMNYIRGTYEDYSFSADVSNASCLQCHNKVIEASIHRDGIVVSHRDIVTSGGKCVWCHSTVGHPEAVPEGARTHPVMATCLRCHNDVIAPFECGMCHEAGTQPVTPPDHTEASG